jgi:hypothetical protein
MKNKIIENIYYSSRTLRIVLWLILSVALIISLPLLIVVAPFIIAWELSWELTTPRYEESDEELFEYDLNNKWGDFSSEFAKWKNLGEL